MLPVKERKVEVSVKKRPNRRAVKLVGLEAVFEDVREALIYDLMPVEMQKHFVRGTRSQVKFNLNIGPNLFHRFQQCNLFDKRIIWSHDQSFEVLAKKSYIDFVESQETFQLPEPLNLREHLVLSKAAEIVKVILGDFSIDRWLDSCTFGKRAAVDLPRAVSYLDTRMERLNGTYVQKGWFNECLCRDVHLLRAVRQRRKSRRYKTRWRIKATAVPKSYKSARIVFPDTTIGGYLSRGLGDMIREALEKGTSIDLALQQELHRKWAQEASVTGQSATIDMKKASDSYVRRHMEYLMPEDWLRALDAVRVEDYEVDGVYRRFKSFMLMGSGHTFPLQTLLFYSLAEATRILMKVRGRVSVYGDDIIIPTRMAPGFVGTMTELGFKINSEKSFLDKHDPDMPSMTLFRESCGGDFKGGVDVRPYMPECNLQESGAVPRNEAVAWCHKMINGLLERWPIEEIPLTIMLLLQTIVRLGCEIHFVPKREPESSGVRYELPKWSYLGLPVHNPEVVASIPYYRKLVEVRKKRPRDQRERAYYWYALKAKDLPPKRWSMYDKAISLNGETLKTDKGQYRWKMNRDLSQESAS